jgi:microcystin degradation protein MlrC
MRIAIARFGQETSTFSPLPTTLEHFREFGIYEGQELLDRHASHSVIGGFCDVATETGLEYTPLPIIHGWAGAGGTITAEAIDFFAEKLAAGLKKVSPIDGLFFPIHGAAAAENAEDAEGYLLQVVRDAIGPDVPIVSPMDHHANITRLKMKCLTGLVGHRTQPHNPYDSGRQAAHMLFAILRGEIVPTMAWQKIPLITHQERFLTSDGPMKEWFDLARAFENMPGVVSASNFPMQPWLDVHEGGWAAVVVTDNDLALARRLAAELANKAWELRAGFLAMDSVPPAIAVRRAEAAPRGLVVLPDVGDTVWGGATGDSTCILEEMLKQDITSTALVPIVDAEAVEIAIQAGIGNEITVSVGGKLDPIFSHPIQVTGRVAAIGGGRLTPDAGGREPFDMGRAVLLEVGRNIKLMVSELRGVGGNHPIVYQHLGIDPGQAKMVVIKTTSNWQYYAEWMSELIRVDTPGPTTSHLETLTWQRLPRPIYPLDEISEWKA